MGIEKVLLKSEEKMGRGSVAAFLRNLADKVESGQVVLKQGQEEISLSLPQDLVLEIKVEEETKGKGIKMCLEVEMEWYEGQEGGGRIELA